MRPAARVASGDSRTTPGQQRCRPLPTFCVDPDCSAGAEVRHEQNPACRFSTFYDLAGQPKQAASQARKHSVNRGSAALRGWGLHTSWVMRNRPTWPSCQPLQLNLPARASVPQEQMATVLRCHYHLRQSPAAGLGPANCYAGVADAGAGTVVMRREVQAEAAPGDR